MSTEVTVEAPAQKPKKMWVIVKAHGLYGEFLVPEEYFAELLSWLAEHRAQEVK